MSIFRKFLKDKDGNTIIPFVDKGSFPEDVVYHDDPTEIEPETPWVSTSMIEDGAVTADKLSSNAVTTGKINNSAVTADKIASKAVTSAKMDWSTMDNVGQFTKTTKGTATINISSFIPDGSTFIILSAGYVNLKAGNNWSIRSSYNGTSSSQVWVDNKTSSAVACPMSSVQLCTKVSGVNTITFETTANHSNYSEISHTIIIARIG